MYFEPFNHHLCLQSTSCFELLSLKQSLFQVEIAGGVIDCPPPAFFFSPVLNQVCFRIFFFFQKLPNFHLCTSSKFACSSVRLVVLLPLQFLRSVVNILFFMQVVIFSYVEVHVNTHTCSIKKCYRLFLLSFLGFQYAAVSVNFSSRVH